MQTPILLNSTGGSANVTDLFLNILFLGFLTVWFWSFFHCIFNDKIDRSKKIIGAILIVTLAHLGSLIYFLLPRENQDHAPVRA